MNENNLRKILLSFVVAVAAIIIYVGVVLLTNQQRQSGINSFEDCKKAGNPIMESYPAQCRAGNRTFVEQLN